MFDKKVLSTLLILAGVFLVIYLLRPLIPAFCLALVLIYLANPMADAFEKYVKKRFFAASASFLVIIVSFIVVTLLLLGEVVSEAQRLPEYLQTQQVFQDLNLFQRISESELIRNLLTANGIQLIAKVAFQAGNALIQLFFGFVISFFVVWKQVRIPVEDEKIRQVLTITDRGIKSVVLSLLLTAIITGLISIPIYWVFDLPYPLLLAALTAFLTLLPVIGAWLLYIPITGYLFFARSIPEGLLFLAVCAIFISTVPDIVVRPIAGKTKEVGAIPLLIGFTSGLMVFGVSGIVLGPLIVIAAIGFWKVFLEKPQVAAE